MAIETLQKVLKSDLKKSNDKVIMIKTIKENVLKYLKMNMSIKTDIFYSNFLISILIVLNNLPIELEGDGINTNNEVEKNNLKTFLMEKIVEMLSNMTKDVII